jgi:hypothetical protein
MIDYAGGFTHSNTVLAVLQQSRQSISLYPNPAGNILSLRSNSLMNGKGNVVIVDMAGRTVYLATVYATSALIDISVLANGTYFLTYDNGDQQETTRFIKQ